MSLSVVISCMAFVWPCAGQGLDKTVQKAYELRKQGQVDKAKTLLDIAISKNPNNAAAHYELARVQLHRALGKEGTILFASTMNSLPNTISKSPNMGGSPLKRYSV